MVPALVLVLCAPIGRVLLTNSAIRGKIGWKVQLISINRSCVGTFFGVHFSILKSLGFSMDLMVEIPSHHMDLSNNGLIYEIRTR